MNLVFIRVGKKCDTFHSLLSLLKAMYQLFYWQTKNNHIIISLGTAKVVSPFYVNKARGWK